MDFTMGARWQDLPEKYPSPSACWRRLKIWEEQDLWLTIWRLLSMSWIRKTKSSGRSASWREALFQLKRGPKIGKTKRGKGTKLMVLIVGQCTAHKQSQQRKHQSGIPHIHLSFFYHYIKYKILFVFIFNIEVRALFVCDEDHIFL